MKAIVHHEYGSPDVLKLAEVDKPTPKENEVLVRIHAAGANRGDWHLLRGEPFPVRLMGNGLLKPKNKIPGADISGHVETVGGSVKQFQPGDEVFGNLSEHGWGAFAEYVCVPEEALVLKPDNITFEEAAAVPLAAVTALQGLRDKGQIRPGKKVLINGASGGVGSFAIRIAKSFDVEVTAVCSTRNVETARSIGADHVIDYTQEDFTQNGLLYDLIFDTVGNRSAREYERALDPDGIFVTTAFLPGILFRGLWLRLTGGKQMINMMSKSNKKDLAFVKELLEAGKAAPVIDRLYPLNQTADAIRYLGEGHAQGKVVITLG